MAKCGNLDAEMRKSAPTTSRRSNSKPSEALADRAAPFSRIEIDRIENQRKNVRGWTKAVLFEKFNVESAGSCGRDTFYKLLSKGKRQIPAQSYQRTALAKAFGWTAEQFAGFLKTGTASPRDSTSLPPSADDTPLKVFRNAEKRDRKNVVINPRISEALLENKPPSLLECVEATEMRWLLDPEKDYNHLFGISTVLLVKLPDRVKPVTLWYPRRPRVGIPEPRQGLSILFNASFTRDFPGKPSPADLWVELAYKDRVLAREEFVRIPGGTLLKLIEYHYCPGISN